MQGTSDKKLTPCKFFFIYGNCRNRDNCLYSHGIESSLPAVTSSASPSSRICARFIEDGVCSYGKRCRYSHPSLLSPRGRQINVSAAPAAKEKAPPAVLHSDPPFVADQHRRNTNVAHDHRRAGISSPAVADARVRPNQRSVPQLHQLVRFISTHRRQSDALPLQPPEGRIHKYLDRSYRIREGRISVIDPTEETSPPSSQQRADGRETTSSQVLQPGESAIHCTPKGIVPFNPNRMYPIDQASMMAFRFSLDLRRLDASHSVRLTLPTVPAATGFRFFGTSIVFFLPHENCEALGKPYYRGISVYRWDLRRECYSHCFNREYESHHITCVSATGMYLVLGRLPFDWLQLVTMVEKERLTQELTREVESHRREERLRKERMLAQRLEAERKRDEGLSFRTPLQILPSLFLFFFFDPSPDMIIPLQQYEGAKIRLICVYSIRRRTNTAACSSARKQLTMCLCAAMLCFLPRVPACMSSGLSLTAEPCAIMTPRILCW